MDTVLVVVVTVLVAGCDGTDAVLKRSCTETEFPRVSLPLACPANHMIHVLQWLTAIGSEGDVSQCQFHADCSNSGDNDNEEFFPSCNGKAACNEEVDLNRKNYCFNGTKLPYVQLEYECIPETWILNICDFANASASSLNASSLYVKTLAFPGNYGIVTNQSCTCDVRGRNLTAKVLSLTLSDRSAMSIADDSSVVWRVATMTQQWNRDIAGLQEPGTSLLNITFHDHGSRGEEAWLQISGSDRNISIACGRGDTLGGTTVTPSTSTLPTTSNAPPSAMSPSPTTAVSSTPSVTTPRSEVSPNTSTVDPSLTSTAGVPVTSSPAHHSSSADVPPVTTPDVNTLSTDPATQHSNASCVNASCPVGPTGSASVTDGLVLDERTILIIAICASVGGVLLLIFIIVVIVLCRRRRRRRREDKLRRVPAPNGDLYTVCSKSPRKDNSCPAQRGRRHNNAAVAPYAWHDLHLPPDPPGGEGVGQAGEMNSHLYWTVEPQPQTPPPSKGGNSKGDNQPLYWVVEPESDNLRRFLGEQRVWPTESPRDYKDVHPYAVADIYTQKGQRPAAGVPIKRYQSADTDLQYKPKDYFLGQTRLRNAHSYEKPTNKRNSFLSSLLFFSSSSKQDAKKPADDDKDSAIGYSASDEAASENISSILRVREDFDPFAAQHSGDSDNSDGEIKLKPARVRRVEGKRGKPAIGVVVTSRPRPKVATVEVHSSPQAERPLQPPPPPPQPDKSARRDHRRYNTKPYEIVTLNNEFPVMTTVDEAGDDQDWQTKHDQRWDGGDDQPWNADLGQQWNNGYGRMVIDANGQLHEGGGGQPWEARDEQNWENGAGHNWRDGDNKHWDTRNSEGLGFRDDLGGGDNLGDRDNQTWDTRGDQRWDQGGDQDDADGQHWEDRDSQPWSGEHIHPGEDYRWDGSSRPPEAEKEWEGSYRGGRTSSTDADTESNLDDDNFLYDDVLFEKDQTPHWKDLGPRFPAGDTSVTLPYPPEKSERGPVGTGLSKWASTDKVWRDGDGASDSVPSKEETLRLGDGEGEDGMLQAILHSQETWC